MQGLHSQGTPLQMTWCLIYLRPRPHQQLRVQCSQPHLCKPQSECPALRLPCRVRLQGIEGSRLVYEARLASLQGRHFEPHPDAMRYINTGSTLSRLLSIRMRGSEVDQHSPRWVIFFGVVPI